MGGYKGSGEERRELCDTARGSCLFDVRLRMCEGSRSPSAGLADSRQGAHDGLWGWTVEQLTDFVVAFWNLAADMSLLLLVGFVAAGLLRVLVPEGWVYRQLGKDSVPAIFKASLLGAPLPLCSCGVLPVAAQLKAGGAARPAMLAFLISMPLTGIDSVLATYALLGGFMAVVRPVASLLVAISGGLTLMAWTQKERKKRKKREIRLPPRMKHRRFALQRFREGLTYAFTDLLGGVARPTLAGLLVGGAILVWLPSDFIGHYLNKGPLPYLLAVALGVPAYVCATGAVPVAAALMLKGLSPGAALAFLIVGPATNSVALTVSRDLVGRKGFWILMAVLGVGAVVMGGLTDLLASLLGVSSVEAVAHAHGDHSVVWSALSMVAAGILLFLLAYRGLAVPLFYRLRDRVPTQRPATGFPTVILRVPEAECSRCSATIKATLQHLDEVRTVQVDLDRRLVTVELRARFSSASLVNTLAQAGYDSKVVAE